MGSVRKQPVRLAMMLLMIALSPVAFSVLLYQLSLIKSEPGQGIVFTPADLVQNGPVETIVRAQSALDPSMRRWLLVKVIDSQCPSCVAQQVTDLHRDWLALGPESGHIQPVLYRTQRASMPHSLYPEQRMIQGPGPASMQGVNHPRFINNAVYALAPKNHYMIEYSPKLSRNQLVFALKMLRPEADIG